MKVIRQTYKINAPVEKVWQALVDPKIIDDWGAGPAKMDDKVGAKFSLWGGDVFGTNTKVVRNKFLEQDWYRGNWPEPSKVTFKLSSEGSRTIVRLTHKDLPQKEIDDHKDG